MRKEKEKSNFKELNKCFGKKRKKRKRYETAMCIVLKERKSFERAGYIISRKKRKKKKSNFKVLT